MGSVVTKRGKKSAVNGSAALRPGLLGSKSGKNGQGTQEQLRRLAQEIMSELSELDQSHSEELLGSFVTELFRICGEQKYYELRRQRQAEGIAAAKARGVHFGPQRRELPDGFEELRQAWREKRMTLQAAAAACGVPKTTFRNAALRVEMAANGAEDTF